MEKTEDKNKDRNKSIMPIPVIIVKIPIVKTYNLTEGNRIKAKL
jgi:hypothetical protein